MSDRSAQHIDAVHTNPVALDIRLREHLHRFNVVLLADEGLRGQNAEVLCLLSATPVCVNLTSSIKELALTAVTGVAMT